MKVHIAALLVAYSLTACASPGIANTPTVILDSQGTNAFGPSLSSPSFLYVLTERCSSTSGPCVKEYAPPQYTSVVRTIRKGLVAPEAMAFDKSSNLYVASRRGVTVYAPGKTSATRTLSVGKGYAVALAFDKLDNLYVACSAGTSGSPYVVTFLRGKARPRLVAGSTIIKAPHAVALDRSNNLYVGGEGKVWVFGLGGGLHRAIAKGVGTVSGLALDARNNLYVANLENSKPNGPGSITKYKSNTSTLAKTITNGIVNPWAIAIDSTGNLYVASSCLAAYSSSCSNWWVSVYAPQRAKEVSPALQIIDGIQNPKSLALGPNGDLFVANCGGCSRGTVTVYAPGGATVQQTIVVRPGAAGPRQVMFAAR